MQRYIQPGDATAFQKHARCTHVVVEMVVVMIELSSLRSNETFSLQQTPFSRHKGIQNHICVFMLTCNAQMCGQIIQQIASISCCSLSSVQTSAVLESSFFQHVLGRLLHAFQDIPVAKIRAEYPDFSALNILKCMQKSAKFVPGQANETSGYPDDIDVA